MSPSARRVPCLLATDVVKERRDALGLTNAQLAKAVGCTVRALQHWLHGDLNRRPDIEQVERLAAALGLGVQDIISADLPLEEEERIFAEGGALAFRTKRGSDMTLQTLREHGEKFIRYARHFNFRLTPLRGYVRRFEHDGKVQSTYASVKIKPGAAVESADFIFSFCLGLMRIDYGAVEMRGRTLTVRPFFASYVNNAELSEDGDFRVRTWFGAEPCTFIVRCRQVDFNLNMQLTKAAGHQHDVAENDVVTFTAGPHHIVAAPRG